MKKTDPIISAQSSCVDKIKYCYKYCNYDQYAEDCAKTCQKCSGKYIKSKIRIDSNE
jgi:hypothetical protein